MNCVSDISNCYVNGDIGNCYGESASDIGNCYGNVKSRYGRKKEICGKEKSE